MFFLYDFNLKAFDYTSQINVGSYSSQTNKERRTLMEDNRRITSIPAFSEYNKITKYMSLHILRSFSFHSGLEHYYLIKLNIRKENIHPPLVLKELSKLPKKTRKV